ncbi:MAG: Slp family lipoprotein [Rhodanobacteraceae bacterium]
MRKLILPALLAATLGSCATVPVPLQGEFNAVVPNGVVKSGQTGQHVRWGGEIISVKPKPEQTCFEILDRELGVTARPRERAGDVSGGRFIACRSGFYDPELFQRGREATVVGRVIGTETGKVGEYEYTYPLVAADAIYLWPERPVYTRSYYDSPFFYNPYWGGPYGGGPFWGYGTFGWGTPVIVVPSAGHHHVSPSGAGH